MLTARGGGGGRDGQGRLQPEAIGARPDADLRGGWVGLADGSDAVREGREWRAAVPEGH